MCGRDLLLVAGFLALVSEGAMGERVFTVFAHGTGGHRSGRDLELVTEFGAAYWGRGAEHDSGVLPPRVNGFYREHYGKDFLILDGVGTCDMSDADGEEIGLATVARRRHPMPGDFEPDHPYKRLKPLEERVSEMKFPGGKNRGDLHGDGWDDNVAHALWTLDQLDRRREFPEVINMIGWSRGAVTCLKLANAIEDYFVEGKALTGPGDYREGYAASNLKVLLEPTRNGLVRRGALEVNLFLIDPVPGRFGATGESNRSERSTERFPPEERDYRVLPATVRDCLITLANDEQREGFAPLDADDLQVVGARTRVVWLPFPGIHRTQLRVEPRDPVGDGADAVAARAALTAVPRLVWDLAWRFMLEHGSRFERDVLAEEKFGGRALTAGEVADLYADVWLKKALYHTARNRGVWARIQGGLQPRLYTGYPFAGREYSGKNPFQVFRGRSELATAAFGVYVEHPGFFINEHHRASFERAFPRSYRWLTSDGGETGGGAMAMPGRMREELEGSGAVVGQLASLGLFLDAGRFREFRALVAEGKRQVVEVGFRRGEFLGERLRKGATAEGARFTGMLEGMGVVPGG